MNKTDDVQQKNREKQNANRFVWSNGLQNIGDQVLSAKTVLPWLFGAAGVPHFFTGLLVPIRESGSMLPQAAFTPWITTRSSRKRLWILGALGQGIAGALIGLSAFALRGVALGIAVVVFLGILALFRALCSVAGKDVQGRTISKGTRGQVTGRATALGGAVTLVVGLILQFFGELSVPALAALTLGAACTWFLAAAVFTGILEPKQKGKSRGIDKAWWRDTWELYSENRDFRSFVHVRALMLVSALSTSFIVTLSLQAGTEALTGLGGFVLASGLAALVGGRVTGKLSDKSSRNVMAGGAALASVCLILLVASAAWLPTGVNTWVFPIGFFLVNLAHTAVRVARKTYVVDMATGDTRTRYVGAANTMMGVILLIVGGISALIALAGPSVALLFLAAIGLAGVVMARRLPEVSEQ